jgi:hypothetical protein
VVKSQPSFAAAFKQDTHLQPTSTAQPKAGNGKKLITEGTALVAANLPVGYQRTIAMLSAESGLTKKDLMQEAFDMLFKARGRSPV